MCAIGDVCLYGCEYVKLDIFRRFYMGLAKQASMNSCDPVPSRLQWLFSPYGYKYFMTQKFSYECKNDGLPFSVLGNKADPLAYVMKVSSVKFTHFNVHISIYVLTFPHYFAGLPRTSVRKGIANNCCTWFKDTGR